MSQYSGSYAAATSAGDSGSRPATQVAREETAEVGRTAADAAGQLAGTAAEQARNVAQEAKTQARDLVGEARGQLQQQARNGQQKATEGIRTLVRELRDMAEGGQQSGPVSEAARQVADRADRVADWLGEREPGELIEEVRSFARRRPGAFLLSAALAGVVVGRSTRGVIDAAGGPSALSAGSSGQAYGAPDYLAGRPGPAPFDSPVAAPLPPAGTAAPRPYAPPADPYDTARSSGPLGAPAPAGPVTRYPEPGYGAAPLTDPTGAHGLRPGARTVDEYADELEGEAGRRPGGLADEPYRSEYGGSR
jgi:gas vesicle protein